jgi:cell wall-associated NlpC family hydrolase
VTKEETERQTVIAEAKTWLGTPYHHMGRVKNAGTDCAMILAEVFEAVGLIPHLEIEHYPLDWMNHRDEERYLGWVKKYAHEVTEPRPGDIALFRFGRCISHGAIVVEWPMVIHSYIQEGGVCISDASKGALEKRLHSFYSFWGE